MALTSTFINLKTCFFVLTFLIIIFYHIQPVDTLQCYCVEEMCNHRDHTSCKSIDEGSRCFASVTMDKDTKQLTRKYGCMHHESATLQCKANLVPTHHPSNIYCCDNDMCNKDVVLMPNLVTTTLNMQIVKKNHESEKQRMSMTIGIISIGFSIAILISVLAFLIIRHRMRTRGLHLYLGVDKGSSYTDSGMPRSELIRYLEQTESSGSGSGLPLMVQRTIAREINLIQSVGKGRYGEVWRGHWRSRQVAVKVFYSTEENSWKLETELYNSNLLRHDNILGFIASDIKGTGSWTQLFLITEYHNHGSLYDYLKTAVISLDDRAMLVICYSIACGLSHLHTEIHGTKGKSAIAHRDIKSKNILVKDNGQCCIADLGLAITYKSEGANIGMSENLRQGTKRYMSPEVLDESLHRDKFEAFKQSDMYSFALVLWEVARRTTAYEKCQEYQEPYYDLVDRDPSFEDMRTVVCKQKLRPQTEDSWRYNESMKGVSEIMVECWDADQTVRLSALRANKRLNDLLEHHASLSTTASIKSSTSISSIV